jgi:hypothetical protein
MKVKIEVELEPFKVPNFVVVKPKPHRKNEGFKDATSIPIGELPADVIYKLCEDFTAAVYAKARIGPPDRPA